MAVRHRQYRRRMPAGFVDATRAREHLRKLSAAHVGRDAVSDVTGLSVNTITCIRQGKQQWIKKETEDLLLAVTEAARADHSLVSAETARWRVQMLRLDGFSLRQLGPQLGRKSGLVIPERITARKEMLIEKLYRQLTTNAAGAEQ